MKNEHNIEQFDELLKQSVEGFQMPVPNGVWESVGASIGSKAAVVSKAAFIKSIIVKSVAAVVLSGGVIYGAYTLISEEKVEKNPENQPVISVPTTIDKDTFIQNEQASVQIENGSSNQVNPQVVNNHIENTTPRSDSGLIIKQSNPQINNEIKASKAEVPVVSNPVKTETGKTSEATTNQGNIDNNVKPPVPEQIVPPNVFTPYDLDGYNDCYKIHVENAVNYVLQIFDTNGNKVFETNDKNACWDGRNGNTGIMCSKGFYVFKLYFEVKSGYKRTMRGELNLL